MSKKYWFLSLVFLVYQILLFVNKMNGSNPLPYLNFIIYFMTFIIINETLKFSIFNKIISILFYLLYGYLAIFMSLSILARNIEGYYNSIYIIFEITLRLLILLISLYLFLYSLKFLRSEKFIVVLSLIISILIIILNYYNYIFKPVTISSKIWEDWVVRNYVSIVLSIIFLLVFWYRYYIKSFVVSESLNLIIFLFTLSNMIEALHFVAFQWDNETWFKGQLFNFFVNILMLGFWYTRLCYLNSEIAVENERYLMNFQFLNGIIAKPRRSIISNTLPNFSTRAVIGVSFGLIFILLILYFIEKITLYLLLNTIFILFIAMLALYFSISSLRRDWQTQIDILLKNRKD